MFLVSLETAFGMGAGLDASKAWPAIWEIQVHFNISLKTMQLVTAHALSVSLFFSHSRSPKHTHTHGCLGVAEWSRELPKIEQ